MENYKDNLKYSLNTYIKIKKISKNGSGTWKLNLNERWRDLGTPGVARHLRKTNNSYKIVWVPHQLQRCFLPGRARETRWTNRESGPRIYTYN